jgi:phospholipid/cholesterol/gamma-HCH transport system substrate-binding protein
MKKYGNEFKVGLFVILCAAGLVYLTLSTGKIWSKEGYCVYAVFDDVAGLQAKAPVMLNGLEVGKVEDVKPCYDNNMTRIILKLRLNKDAKVRENPVVAIKTLGLMGEKYIQISSCKGNNFVSPESTLEGKPYMDLDALTSQAESVSKQISGLVTNINGLTDEVKKLTGNLNLTLDDNKDEISRILANLEITTKNFEEFSSDLKAHPWKLLFKTKEKEKKP